MFPQENKQSKQLNKGVKDEQYQRDQLEINESNLITNDVIKKINASINGKLNISSELIPFDIPSVDPDGLQLCDETQNRTMVHVQVTRCGEIDNGVRNYSGVDTWAVGYENVSGVFDDVVKELRKNDTSQLEGSHLSPCSESIFKKSAKYESKTLHLGEMQSSVQDLRDKVRNEAITRNYSSSAGFSDGVSKCDASWEESQEKHGGIFVSSPIASTKDAEEKIELLSEPLPVSNDITPTFSPEGRFRFESTSVGVNEPQIQEQEITGRTQYVQEREHKGGKPKVMGYSFKMKKNMGFNLRYNPDAGASLLFDERSESIKLLEKNESAAIILKLRSGKPVCVRVVRE